MAAASEIYTCCSEAITTIRINFTPEPKKWSLKLTMKVAVHLKAPVKRVLIRCPEALFLLSSEQVLNRFQLPPPIFL